MMELLSTESRSPNCLEKVDNEMYLCDCSHPSNITPPQCHVEIVGLLAQRETQGSFLRDWTNGGCCLITCLSMVYYITFPDNLNLIHNTTELRWGQYLKVISRLTPFSKKLP